jgi:hypothetical protein
MTRTRRRGPNTVMPITRPVASMATPPSALRRMRRSSSIRALISPPRSDHHGPTLRDTTPNAAVGAPSSAPTARASAPTGTGWVSSGIAGRSESIDPQDRDVGRMITTSEVSRDGLATRQRDSEVAFFR